MEDAHGCEAGICPLGAKVQTTMALMGYTVDNAATAPFSQKPPETTFHSPSLV